MDNKTQVLIIDDSAQPYLPRLREQAPTCEFHGCQAGESVSDALARVQPEIVFGLHGGRYPAFSHAVALDYPSVKWMHNGGAGIDHLTGWDSDRITVTNSAGVSSRFMAETVTGAILMMNFGFPKYLEQQQQHIWEKQPWESLSTKTVLVIGLGGIGTLVANRMRMFGAHVIGARRTARACDEVDEQVAMSDVPEVLPRADYVCIHVPNTEETQNLVDAEFLSRMKPTARLINTARGAQADEAALISALQERRIAGAYLDVFRTEPLPADSPFWDLPGVLITPHHADAAEGWKSVSAAFFAENLKRFLQGRALQNICNPASGY
ncbi:D-2-hydroxyacid dehydrogenase [Roseovarius sp. MMSF_3281]|uniref:D-2-hydroxyacid dehydrogenase n=1 Tax=Roseovarius sp. MMSF_3281 TaxID=3046694 RepID=UPI00273E51F1|nr:D-2-hydroxyacid dehydrogenase [Roseovarius sp. MMSF_3281]